MLCFRVLLKRSRKQAWLLASKIGLFKCCSQPQRGDIKIFTAQAGTSSLRITIGTTTHKKRATSSGTERICLRFIEEGQKEQSKDEQKEWQEQSRERKEKMFKNTEK